MEGKDKVTGTAGCSSPSELCVQLRDTRQAWKRRVSGELKAVPSAHTWQVKEIQINTQSPPDQSRLSQWLAAAEEDLAVDQLQHLTTTTP